MYRETQYLTWANRFFGSVEHNLAKGGVPAVPLRELGRPDSRDLPQAWETLRKCVARYNGLETNEVLPALGTTHALWLAFTVLVAPGDTVLVEAPAYEPLWRIPQGMGARVAKFERDPDQGFAATAESVACHLTPRTRVVVLTNLHNPSGVRTSTAELYEVAKLCASVGATLLVDEVYAPYGAVIGPDGVWGQSARLIAPNIVAVSGLSKAYGLGALRVGWLAADPSLIRAAEHVIQSSLGDPPLVQASLGAHAFSHLPALSRTGLSERSARLRAAVAAWVAARPQLSWHEPEQGPFGFVSVTDVEDLTATIELGAAQHGVLVAPGSFFGRPNAFRLGWSVPSGQLAPALTCLDRALASNTAASRPTIGSS